MWILTLWKIITGPQVIGLWSKCASGPYVVFIDTIIIFPHEVWWAWLLKASVRDTRWMHTYRDCGISVVASSMQRAVQKAWIEIRNRRLRRTSRELNLGHKGRCSLLRKYQSGPKFKQYNSLNRGPYSLSLLQYFVKLVEFTERFR